MSNIVFSFDANAAGLLGALGAIEGGISSLISATESLASSFVSINSSAETLGTAWTNLFTNYNQLTNATDAGSASMGRASSSASNLAYQLQQLGERASDTTARHADMVQQIEQQEQNLTQTTQDEIAKRTSSFDESMQKLVTSHQDAIAQIQDQEENLAANYLDTINNRLVKIGDPLALQHKAMSDSIAAQIDAMLATGNTSGIAALEAQLNAENTKYSAYLQNTIEPYYKDIDSVAAKHYQQQTDKLTDSLNKQNQQYDAQRQYLIDNYNQQISDLNKHYAQQEALLDQHLAKENQTYAQQMERIAEERDHLLTSGGGGGGGGGAGGTDSGLGPATAGYIDLFRRLGIDPSKDPAGASQAIQSWILGMPFRGQSMGQGAAFQSQLTIPTIQALIGQYMQLGQDPTRNLRGSENYVQLFSDLVGYAQSAAPQRGEADISSSLMQIMQKAASGNTTGLLRQLTNLGITKEALAQNGVKFSGKTGQTIDNPQDVMDALLNLAHNRSGGLGEKLATTTFSGLMNQFKDVWTRTALEIGDPNNPNGLWKQLVNQLSILLQWVMGHSGDFVNFGKTVFTWVVGAFAKFNEIMASPTASKVLADIGKGFREIGDALSWLGQHKEILLLLGGLLGAQVGTKLLQGVAGGVMGLGGKFLSGGLAGPAAGLLGGLPGMAGGAASGIGSMFGAGSQFGGDALRAAQYFTGMGGVRSGLGVAGTATFNDFGSVAGISGGAARTGGFFTNPLETAGIVGKGAVDKLSSIATTLAGMAASGFGRVVGMAGAVGSAVTGAAGTFTAAGGGLSGLAALAAPAVSAIGPALMGIAAAAGPILLVAAAVAGLVAVFVMNRQKIMPFIDMLIHFFTVQLKGAVAALQSFAKDVESRLGAAFGPGSVTYAIIMFFAKFWLGAWGGIQLAFQGVWNIISGVIKVAWAIISGIVLIGLDILGGKWGLAWTDMQKMVKGIFDGLGSIFKGAFQVIGGIFIGFFLGLWNMIAKPLEGVGTNISKWISGVGSGMTTFFTQTIPTALANAFSGMGVMLKKGVDWLVDHVLPGPLQGPVHSALGFADGGYYPGKQISLVGERGPELFFSGNAGAVVSFERIRQAFGIGNGANDDGSSMSGNNRPINIIGPLYIQGVQDPQGFYTKLNKIAGRRAEYGERGSRL